MKIKRFLPAALFLAGLTIGFLANGRETAANARQTASTVPVPADASRTTKVVELFDAETTGIGHPTTVEIVPWRVEENGVVQDFDDAERHLRMWIVSIDGGRIRVFGTSK